MDTALAPIFIYLQKMRKKFMYYYSYTQKHKVDREKNITCIFSLCVTEIYFLAQGKSFLFTNTKLVSSHKI